MNGIRELRWVGTAQKDLREFPKDVMRKFGYDLDQIQRGVRPHDAEWMWDIRGVQELKEPFNTNTYRVVYTVKLKKGVYVLHAFMKKSTQGIKTTQRDIDLIRQRLKEAMEVDAQP